MKISKYAEMGQRVAIPVCSHLGDLQKLVRRLPHSRYDDDGATFEPRAHNSCDARYSLC